MLSEACLQQSKLVDLEIAELQKKLEEWGGLGGRGASLGSGREEGIGAREGPVSEERLDKVEDALVRLQDELMRLREGMIGLEEQKRDIMQLRDP